MCDSERLDNVNIEQYNNIKYIFYKHSSSITKQSNYSILNIIIKDFEIFIFVLFSCNCPFEPVSARLCETSIDLDVKFQ